MSAPGRTVVVNGESGGISMPVVFLGFILIIGVSLLIAWAVNPDLFKSKKEGDECQGSDVDGIYEFDKKGDCVLVACDTGYEIDRNKCVKKIVTSTPTPTSTPGSGPGPDSGPVDCVGTWDEWSTCTKTCGGGTQVRSYNITTKPVLDGAACPTSPEERACNETACPDEKVITKSSVNPDDPNEVPSHGWLVAPNGNMIWPRDDGTVGQYPRWNDPKTVWTFEFDTGTKKHRLVKDGNMYWTNDLKLRSYPRWADPKTLWEIKKDSSTGKFWLIAPTGSMIYLANDDSRTMWEYPFWPDPNTLWDIVPT